MRRWSGQRATNRGRPGRQVHQTRRSLVAPERRHFARGHDQSVLGQERCRPTRESETVPPLARRSGQDPSSHSTTASARRRIDVRLLVECGISHGYSHIWVPYGQRCPRVGPDFAAQRTGTGSNQAIRALEPTSEAGAPGPPAELVVELQGQEVLKCRCRHPGPVIEPIGMPRDLDNPIGARGRGRESCTGRLIRGLGCTASQRYQPRWRR